MNRYCEERFLRRGNSYDCHVAKNAPRNDSLAVEFNKCTN